jgi:hypothetical protein
MICRAHAIEMDLTVLKPHVEFFYTKKMFITGISVSFYVGCLGQKWMNDFIGHILERAEEYPT